MAEIRPFHGIRYNPERAGELSSVVSPPYDVIGPELQEELYQRSPHNVVRIDLAKTEAGDTVTENRYTRAAATFRAWLGSGVLSADPSPCLYYLEEDYPGEFGEPKTRRGFLAAVRVEDEGSGIYRPHEKTMARPKEDRLRLTEACRANTSAVFSVYDDPEMRVQQCFAKVPYSGPPNARVRADDGTETRLWVVPDPAVAQGVAEAMREKSFFIADGHHRYETALNYRDLQRQRGAGAGEDAPWNYVLMYLANMRDPGLTIFPTHRAVFGLEDFDLQRFLTQVRRWFQVVEVPGGMGELQERMKGGRDSGHSFGLIARSSATMWELRRQDGIPVEDFPLLSIPEALLDLDVTVLHALIFAEILGIDERAQEEQRNLRYIKAGEELARVVREEAGFQLGFLLNPTRIDEVKAVAERGQRMPQKSTFFYPKLLTGLLINPLWDLAAER